MDMIILAPESAAQEQRADETMEGTRLSAAEGARLKLEGLFPTGTPPR